MPNRTGGTELVPYKKKRSKKGILPILLVLLLIAGLTATAWYFTRDGDAKASPGGIIVMPTGSGCNREKVAADAMIARGFAPDDFVVGQSNIDWASPEANERGSASFAAATPTTAKALVKELSSETDKAKAAVATLMDESGAKESALLNAKNWVPAQFKVSSSWDGNTAFSNGRAVAAGTRHSAAGDVVWLFVSPTKCKDGAKVVDIVTAHRAGCGNPQTALPRPSKPTTPTTPTTPPPNGEIGKDHRTSPPTTTVVYCPPGQYLDRYTETCVSPPATTTTTDGQGDSGDGGGGTTPPTTSDTAPPPPTTSPPTTTPTPPTIPGL